jgi:hypothetical protein
LRWRCQHHKMRILAGKHSCERMPWTLGHLTSWTTGFLQETMPCLHAASTSCHHCHSTGMCEHFGLVMTGWRFKTRLGFLWIGFAGFTYLCLRQWQREECRFQGKGQQSTSKRSGCCPEIPFQIFPELSKGPTGSNWANLGTSVVERSCEVRLPDYQSGLMRNVVLLSPVGNFLGVRSGRHEVSKRDFS